MSIIDLEIISDIYKFKQQLNHRLTMIQGDSGVGKTPQLDCTFGN